MKRTPHVLFTLVAAFLLHATAAWAQVDRATLTGIVKDPSDAVIPQAQITLTNLATNVVAKATTNNDGTYLVVNLLPGEYLVQAEMTGFQRFEQTIALAIGSRARLDISLPVGTIGEMVTVAGVTPLLSTESAALGTVVNNDEVSKLPLAIRNWDDLMAMVPGVQSDRYTEQAGGTSAGRTGGVSVHGNRSLQNNFLLDGVANNSFSTNVQELTTQISRPSVDAISEFKVITSPYAAEYGWAPGASIVVNTKSGTNSLHGTGYEFFRNDKLDTINYFAKKANQPKPTNKQNQFGGNLGGPLVKNRMFFFGDYEATRIKQGVLRTGRVRRRPSAAASSRARSGIRSPACRSRTTRFRRTASTRSRRRSPASCRCPTRRAATTSSASRTSKTSRTASWAVSTCTCRTTTPCSRATSGAIGSATSPASSAGFSTARRPRRGGGTTSSRTAWSAAGPRCWAPAW